MKTYIEFKKQREVGTILSDTFGFLRNEFKPFFTTILTISGPAIVFFIVTLAFYTYYSGDVFDLDFFGSGGFNGTNTFMLIATLIAFVVASFVAYVYIISSAIHYIKSYINNKGETNFNDIKNDVQQSFWGFFGLSFLKGIAIILTVVMCVLPVLYMMIPMAVVFSIYVFRNHKSSTDAFFQSFKLVNYDFWTAFAAFIVLGILFYILNLAFSVPLIIYTYLKMGIFSGEVDPANLNNIVDPVYILLNILNQLVQYLLNIVLVVGGVFIYFHLNEKENYTGTLELIDEIGKNDEQ